MRRVRGYGQETEIRSTSAEVLGKFYLSRLFEDVSEPGIQVGRAERVRVELTV